jgi:DNA-directed RNA polymerase specialized sigma24 family protein
MTVLNLPHDLEILARATAVDVFKKIKKHVTMRKTVALTALYTLRHALDELSPDERKEWLAVSIAELSEQR